MPRPFSWVESRSPLSFEPWIESAPALTLKRHLWKGCLQLQTTDTYAPRLKCYAWNWEMLSTFFINWFIQVQFLVIAYVREWGLCYSIGANCRHNSEKSIEFSTKQVQLWIRAQAAKAVALLQWRRKLKFGLCTGEIQKWCMFSHRIPYAI